MSLSTARVKKELTDVVIAVGIFFLIQGVLYAALGVFPPYRVVVSGSMEPTYYRGDVIFIKKVDVQQLQRGDIIVFESRGGGTPIVHRITDIVEENGTLYFLTKGDNNPFPDSYYHPLKGVPGSCVVGTPVLRIPKVGWISIYVRNLF